MVFIEWVASRNTNADASMRICPTDLLGKVYPINVLDEWPVAFVLEVRRADGKFYPGTTIKNILSTIHRVLKANLGAQNVVNFIERTSQERFYPCLYGALDQQPRMLHANGIGVQRKRADAITPEIENTKESLVAILLLLYSIPYFTSMVKIFTSEVTRNMLH